MFSLLWFLVVAGELVGSKAKLVDKCRRHLLHLVIVKSLRNELKLLTAHHQNTRKATSVRQMQGKIRDYVSANRN